MHLTVLADELPVGIDDAGTVVEPAAVGLEQPGDERHVNLTRQVTVPAIPGSVPRHRFGQTVGHGFGRIGGSHQGILGKDDEVGPALGRRCFRLSCEAVEVRVGPRVALLVVVASRLQRDHRDGTLWIARGFLALGPQRTGERLCQQTAPHEAPQRTGQQACHGTSFQRDDCEGSGPS